MSTPDAPNQNQPKLTRIPLDQVTFLSGKEPDLPGGNANAPAVNFGPAKVKGRQFFLGYFVPSYQVIDIEWYRTEDDDPEHFAIPMSSVKRFKRSPKKS